MRKKYIGTCDHCGGNFGYYLIHSGFDDSQYAYCDSCGGTTILNVYSKEIPPGIKLSPAFVIDPTMEPLLENCRCGGRFLRGASPRCPHCRSELSATAAREYLERNAPDMEGGWRWQQNWAGLYCIVIDDNVIENNWRKKKQEYAKSSL